MKSILKNQIENLAKELNISFLTACSHVQGAAAMTGNENTISLIHELKIESEEYKAILNQ